MKLSSVSLYLQFNSWLHVLNKLTSYVLRKHKKTLNFKELEFLVVKSLVTLHECTLKDVFFTDYRNLILFVFAETVFVDPRTRLRQEIW